MNYLLELLLGLLPDLFKQESTSAIGESELDRSARRFWQTIAVIIAVLALVGFVTYHFVTGEWLW